MLSAMSGMHSTQLRRDSSSCASLQVRKSDSSSCASLQVWKSDPVPASCDQYQIVWMDHSIAS
jgi:hypothetical protein